MRRARIRTTHASAEAAAVVAGAVEPDNTDSMTTRTDDATVVTTVERETTGGLHSTVDDYVVNLTVADRLVKSSTAAIATDDGGDGDRDCGDDDRDCDEPGSPADDTAADTETPERTDPTDNTRDSDTHDTQP
ncbi:KEOPS complex subunit Pcc1 [Salinigranum sp. GCM10025319]|uniref:KEOPS complex subunit Pcc1 n=1 Tax=Salinigranum sp. GCM10025319 TaxID=3252687 RepID=UPI00360FA32A